MPQYRDDAEEEGDGGHDRRDPGHEAGRAAGLLHRLLFIIGSACAAFTAAHVLFFTSLVRALSRSKSSTHFVGRSS